MKENKEDKDQNQIKDQIENPEISENTEGKEEAPQEAEQKEETDPGREEHEDEDKKKLPTSPWQKLMAVMIALALLVLCILGFALPLRPVYSDSEKRALKEFPKITISAVLNGSFFTDFTTWYSDSFPFREGFLSADSKLEGFYGLQSEAVYIHGEQEMEEIPTAAGGLAPTLAFSDISNASSSEISSEEYSTENQEVKTGDSEDQSEDNPSENQEIFETDAEGNLILPKEEDSEEVSVSGEKAGNIYVTDNRAFELFYFNQKNVMAYASMINTVKSVLPEVNVYDMIVPNSYGVQLEPVIQAKLASTGMDLALDYTYSLMSSDVLKVPVFETLSEHKDEYIYFNTDHHWTQLGAYYAYLEFCKVKGLEPHLLEEFEKVSYGEFYGTFYFSTNRAESLRQNPDTIEAWIPMGTNDMNYTNRDGVSASAHVINDGSSMLAGNRYNTFLLGDNPYTEIENPDINDGSSIVVVKESYGNAFVPFLVDHYQYVYVVDYRYFTDNLTDFIREHGVSDLLFLNNVMALGQKTSDQMLGLFH